MFSNSDIVEIEHALGGVRMPDVRRCHNKAQKQPQLTLRGGAGAEETVERILIRAAHAFGAEILYVPRARLLNPRTMEHKAIKKFASTCHATYKAEVLLSIGVRSLSYAHLFTGNRPYRLKYPRISAARGVYIALAPLVNLSRKIPDPPYHTGNRRHSTHNKNTMEVVAFASARTFHWYNTRSYLNNDNRCGAHDPAHPEKCLPQELFLDKYTAHDAIPTKPRDRRGRILEMHLIANASDSNNVGRNYAKGLGRIVAMLIINKMQGVKMQDGSRTYVPQGINDRKYTHLLAEQLVEPTHATGGQGRYKWEEVFKMECANKLKAPPYNSTVTFKVKQGVGPRKKFVHKSDMWGGTDKDVIYWGRSRENGSLLTRKTVRDSIIAAKLPSNCRKQSLGKFQNKVNKLYPQCRSF